MKLTTTSVIRLLLATAAGLGLGYALGDTLGYVSNTSDELSARLVVNTTLTGGVAGLLLALFSRFRFMRPHRRIAATFLGSGAGFALALLAHAMTRDFSDNKLLFFSSFAVLGALLCATGRRGEAATKPSILTRTAPAMGTIARGALIGLVVALGVIALCETGKRSDLAYLAYLIFLVVGTGSGLVIGLLVAWTRSTRKSNTRGRRMSRRPRSKRVSA